MANFDSQLRGYKSFLERSQFLNLPQREPDYLRQFDGQMLRCFMGPGGTYQRNQKRPAKNGIEEKFWSGPRTRLGYARLMIQKIL